MKPNSKLAECVGLWLAEGDSKTKAEITFTNNCWELVELFHDNITLLFKNYNFNVRIYVYNPTEKKIEIPLKNVHIKYYIDKRATKPYFIWRLASVELVRIWKSVVKECKDNKEFYSGVLRGFFAGEGSIKEGSHSSRVIRISQTKRLGYIDKMLQFFDIDYSFSNHHREGYVIRRKENFDRLFEVRIANLHPVKKDKFEKMIRKYKQTHYKKRYLKKNIKRCFNQKNIFSTQQLSEIFDRSLYRISETLTDLKKEGLIKNFRVRSKDYWILNEKNFILISGIKYKYLNMLKNDLKRTKDMADEAGVCSKSTYNRLRELEKLGLVKRRKDKMWEINKVDKKVIVI